MTRCARWAVVAAVCVLAAAGPAAARTAAPRIVGGQVTTNPGWVAFLRISFPDGSTGLCSGSLVSKTWVLTAAHCVTDDFGNALSPSAVTVWVGLDRLSDATNANASSVDRVEVDPVFSFTTLQGDVAAVRLTAAPAKDPVAFGPQSDPLVGSDPMVLGWGTTQPPSVVEPFPPPSNALQQVDAPILDPGRCAFWNDEPNASFDASSMICAGADPGRDSCSGDSGGPLAFAPALPAAELVGTVDFGSGDCGDGKPAVYQRITSGPVAQWLAGVIPQVQLSLSSATPHHNSTVTASATSTNIAAPEYGWDFNGDGQFTDATGPTVQIPVGTDPLGVAVRAAGDLAARRATIVPLFARVQATAPAQVVEGQPLVLSVAREGNGAGRVTAAVTGAGPAPGAASADVPPATSLTVPIPNDRTWHPPRTLLITVAADGDLSLTAGNSLRVQVLDDDRPVVRIRHVRERSARALVVTVTPPGAGVATVRVEARGRRLATRRFTARSAAPRTVQVPLGATARRRLGGRRPVVRVSWQSSAQRSARATAMRHGPRWR